VFNHPKFEAKKDNHGKTFGRGVDVLGMGAYFVAPPSLHKSGKHYRWAEGKGIKSREVLNLPKNWEQQLKSRSVDLSDAIKQKSPSGSRVSMILEGNRNDHLTSIAGKLHATGISSKTILSALQKENRIHCNPPLDKDEVRGIAKSVGNYPVAVNADSAEALMADVLQRQFDQGRNLIYAADGQFWFFDKTHWAVCPKPWLTGRILATITNSAVRSRQNTSSLVNQTLALLTAKQSINDDRLRFMADPPSIINCRNGEVHLDIDGRPTLHAHRPESYLRSCLDVEFNPDALCPKFDKALATIFAQALDPDEMCRHWHELSGYILMPRRNIPLIGVLYGSGNNGKTTLMKTIARLLGKDQVLASRIGELETNRFMIGNLLGKLVLIDDDVKAGARFPDGPLKTISEAKTLSGEKKFGNTFEFTCLTVPILLCNNSLSLVDVSYGMTRRLMVIPFDQRFTKNTVDRGLFDYIWTNEMPGALNRAIQGLQRVLQRGSDFKRPKAVVQATRDWIKQSNPLPAFIDECCTVDPTASVYVKELYANYLSWAKDSGYTIQQQRLAFQRNLAHLNFSKAPRGSAGPRIGGLKIRRD
jgi:P4 family phage/plasmid primase-like protien